MRKPDTRHVALIVLPLIAMLLCDRAVTNALAFPILAVLLIIGVSHWVRRVMFPYLDLRKSVEMAETSPMSAALLVLSIVLFFGFVLLAVVFWVHG